MGVVDSLYSLIYVSAAINEIDSPTIAQILESARRHNELFEVTGLLLYKEGNFMQVLEGSPAAVHVTMERIIRDSRHHNITVLLKQAIPERHFGLWSMAFPDADQLSEESLRQYSSLDARKSHPQVERERVLRLLYSFKTMFRVGVSS